MDRYVVISADCHAFGPGNGSNDTEQLPQLLTYFDPDYRSEYEDYIAQAREVFEQRERMASLFSGDALESFAEQSAVLSGGTTGLFDSERRLAELEKATGYNFLPDLPESLQKALEARTDSGPTD